MTREFVLVRAWMGFTSTTFFQSHKLSAKANQAMRAQMIDGSTIAMERALGTRWSAHVYAELVACSAEFFARLPDTTWADSAPSLFLLSGSRS